MNKKKSASSFRPKLPSSPSNGIYPTLFRLSGNFFRSHALRLRMGYLTHTRESTHLEAAPQAGSAYHCAHGDDFNATLKILDWKPFDYMSLEEDLGFVKFIQTRIFTPTDTGTKLQYIQTKPSEPAAAGISYSVACWT